MSEQESIPGYSIGEAAASIADMADDLQDERAAVLFYRDNPRAALFDLNRRLAARRAPKAQDRAHPVGEAVAWREIASAPKKPMHPLLLWNGKKVFEGYWGAARYDRKSREWVSAWVASPTSGDTKPTHWAPLPPGPGAALTGDAQEASR